VLCTLFRINFKTEILQWYFDPKENQNVCHLFVIKFIWYYDVGNKNFSFLLSFNKKVMKAQQLVEYRLVSSVFKKWIFI